MRYPKFLEAHDTIGFVAPSFGCSTEPYKSAFNNALKKFSEKGFSTVCGPNVYASHGVGISATPKECGEEFTNAYVQNNSSVSSGPNASSASCASDVLISCGGGELMCEILGSVDFEKVREATPKWFMGYSDNTYLTFLLPTLCDTAAIYGPCAPAFGMEPWHEAIEDAFALLQGKKLSMKGYPLYETESLKDETHPLEPYNVTEKRHISTFNGNEKIEETSFSGRLIGGCLDCLANLVGTKYDRVREFNERYREDGVIWFLEACDLNVFSIRRAIWNLKNAGWFEQAKGFLIGRPLAGQEEMFGLDNHKAVMAMLQDLQVPVLMDLDIGHLPPMMPLISGAMANVRLQGQEMEVEFLLR